MCLQVPEDPENWNLDNGVYEQVVGEFTQNDIMDGKVFYRHVGPHRSDFLFDHIYFRLQDGGLPPNESDMKELIVKVRLWSFADPATVGETELIVKVRLRVFGCYNSQSDTKDGIKKLKTDTAGPWVKQQPLRYGQ